MASASSKLDGDLSNIKVSVARLDVSCYKREYGTIIEEAHHLKELANQILLRAKEAEEEK